LNKLVTTPALENIRSLIAFSAAALDTKEAVALKLSAQLASLHAFYHSLPDTSDFSQNGEPPEQDYSTIRLAAAEAFPFLGPYNEVAATTTEIGKTDIVVGDSLDDLSDILVALKDFSWRMMHTSEADAIWNFKETFRSHWSAHLIGLQRYLAVLTTLSIHHNDNFRTENRNGA